MRPTGEGSSDRFSYFSSCSLAQMPYLALFRQKLLDSFAKQDEMHEADAQNFIKIVWRGNTCAMIEINHENSSISQSCETI